MAKEAVEVTLLCINFIFVIKLLLHFASFFSITVSITKVDVGNLAPLVIHKICELQGL